MGTVRRVSVLLVVAAVALGGCVRVDRPYASPTIRYDATSAWTVNTVEGHNK